jgi:hypothetical protein
MTDRPRDAQASINMVELCGHLSRTEWEMVYVVARGFAQAHGLSIEQFDLQSVENDGQQKGITALVRASDKPGFGP